MLVCSARIVWHSVCVCACRTKNCTAQMTIPEHFRCFESFFLSVHGDFSSVSAEFV
uniref:Uncharacterized protein n=1 Tax=Anopheles minimus TaxID=112268 RepID=A0A182WPU7_9DIPT